MMEKGTTYKTSKNVNRVSKSFGRTLLLFLLALCASANYMMWGGMEFVVFHDAMTHSSGASGARDFCRSITRNGVSGRLVAIPSEWENFKIISQMTGGGWIGTSGDYGHPDSPWTWDQTWGPELVDHKPGGIYKKRTYSNRGSPSDVYTIAYFRGPGDWGENWRSLRDPICEFVPDYDFELPTKKYKLYSGERNYTEVESFCMTQTENGITGRMPVAMSQQQNDLLIAISVRRLGKWDRDTGYGGIILAGRSNNGKTGEWYWDFSASGGPQVHFSTGGTCDVDRYCQWQSNQPNVAAPEVLAIYNPIQRDIYYGGGVWRDATGTDFLPTHTVCEFVKTTSEVQLEGKLIRYFGTATDWDTAKSTCEASTNSEGIQGRLFTVADEWELRDAWDLMTVADPTITGVWIGYSSADGATFMSETGLTMYTGGSCWSDYFPCFWATGEPNLGGVGAVFLTQAGKFRDDLKGSTKPFLCEYTPTTFTSGTGKTYQFVSTPMTHLAANDHCNSLYYNGVQGHVASVANQRESMSFSRLAYSVGLESTLLGASDAAVEGTWKWFDGGDVECRRGMAAYLSSCWQTAAPDGSTGENYMNWYAQSGKWEDVSGATPLAFICAFPAQSSISSKTLVLLSARRTHAECQAQCQALIVKGNRHGVQMATVASSAEFQVALELAVQGSALDSAWIDGTGNAGTWTYSKSNIPFYSSGACHTNAYCNWWTGAYYDGEGTRCYDGQSPNGPPFYGAYTARFVFSKFIQVGDPTHAHSCLCEYPNIKTVGNKDYVFQTTPTTWSNADAACEGLSTVRGSGANLASISTVEENNAIKQLHPGGLDAWIAGTDAGSEGTWTWRDTSTFYMSSACVTGMYCSWFSGQPDNLGGTQHYAAITSNGDWYDHADENRPFVCEYVYTATPSLSSSETETVSTSRSLTIGSQSFSASRSLSNSFTLPGSATVSLSLSPTQTPTSTSSLSATLTDTITPPPTPTKTSTFSITIPLTQTMTLSRTPRPTATSTETSSLGSTLTTTLAQTFTATVSFSLRATTTRTLIPTESATATTTHPLTPTFTLLPTPTATFSHTRLGTFTQSFSRTPTPTLTLTTTKELYCGALFVEECAAMSPRCAATTGGVCYRTECETLHPFPNICLRDGCKWDHDKNSCVLPPDCGAIKTLIECEMSISCRWDITRCVLNTVRCEKIREKATCVSSDCSWNRATAPNCFRPLLVPELCNFIRDKSLCIAQGCLWLAETSFCEAWNVNCSAMPPYPSTCTILGGCFYDGFSRSCMSVVDTDFSKLDYTVVLGASHPTTVFPDEVFAIKLFGSPLSKANVVAFVPQQLPSLCPKPEYFDTTAQNTATVTSVDLKTKASIIEAARISQIGNYTVCIFVNSSHVIGPLSSITVEISDPVIKSCTTSPPSPFTLEYFELIMEGSGLDPIGRVVLIDIGSSQQCTAYNASQSYFRVLSHDSARGMSRIRYRTTKASNLTLCYANRRNVTAQCPNTIEVTGLPPWRDKPTIKRIFSEHVRIRKYNIHTFNNQSNCRSLVELPNTLGFYGHPNAMEVKFGDGTNPYQSNETCIVSIQPMSIEGMNDRARGVILFVNMFSMDSEEEVRFFVPTQHIQSTPLCSGYKTRDACAAAMCQWLGDSQRCTMQFSTRNLPHCPNSIATYSMVRVGTAHDFADGLERYLTLSLRGALVAICTTSSSPKRGLGVHMQYRAQETLCPNDCTDQGGTKRGQCIIVGNQWTCKCNTGYSGKDCSQPALCRGTGVNALRIGGFRGKEAFRISTEDACGIQVVATSSSVPYPVNMVRYGIGVSILNGTLASNDCKKSYIMLRKGSFDGPLLARLCRNALLQASKIRTSGEQYRIIISDSTEVYAEFKSFPGDSLVISYTAVSLVCPGVPGTQGIPETPEEICHGKGTCTQKDFRLGNEMPYLLKQCDCNSPYATSTDEASCDTCAFGFRKDTYPHCYPATICAHNCSGNGVCIPGVGCRCNQSHYALDCQLPDDMERLGELKNTLRQRIPLNYNDAGNVVSSGSVDRTLLPCALAGSLSPCLSDNRTKGRKYPIEKEKVSIFPGSFSSPLRRRLDNDTRTLTNNSAVNQSLLDVDYGLSFNSVAFKGFFPDYVRIDNSSDVAVGTMTICAWVKVTSVSNGFLFAKVDRSFTPSGSSPILDLSAKHIQDRNNLFTARLLRNSTAEVNMAVYLNGARKQVDLLVTDSEKKGSVAVSSDNESMETWSYVRHFRLGSRVRGELFDGTWRFLCLKLFERDGRQEGQVFVDAYSKQGSPDFVQCLPFLPKMRSVKQISVPVTSNLTPFSHGESTFSEAAQSIIWCYGLRGSVDELQIFHKELSQRSVVKVGGPEFESMLIIPSDVLYAMIGILACAVLVVALSIAKHEYDNTKKHQEGQSDELEKGKRCTSEDFDVEMIEVEDLQVEPEPSSKEFVERGMSGGSVQGEAEAPSNLHDRELVLFAPDSRGSEENTATSDRSAMFQSCRSTSIFSPRGVSVALRNSSSNCDLYVTVDDLQDGQTQIVIEDDAHDAQDFVEIDTALQDTPKELNVDNRLLRHINSFHVSLEEAMQGKQALFSDSVLAVTSTSTAQQNLLLLGRIVELKALQESEARQRVEETVKAAFADPSLPSAIEALAAILNIKNGKSVFNVGRISVMTWQFLGQMAVAMNFASQWKLMFLHFSSIFLFNFVPSFGVPFHVMFLTCFVISLLCVVTLLTIRCMTPLVRQKELSGILKDVIADREACLESREPYRSPISIRHRITFVARIILALLYMPTTELALQAIFCSPIVRCQFDCYVDSFHVALVILGVCALLTVSLAALIFYFFTVLHIRLQFHEFIVSFDTDIQEEHWPNFVSSVSSPFSGLYDSYRHSFAFFESAVMALQLVSSILLSALEPESLEQMISVVVLHTFFTGFLLFARPFQELSDNSFVLVCFNFIVSLLMMHAAHLLHPDAVEVGWTIVAITIALLILQVLAVVRELYK